MTKNLSHPKESTVFVIHGRNHKIRDAMFDFLYALGLHPLEWEKIISLTGETSPYIGDVLDKGFEVSQAAIALLTPDDEAQLKQQFWNKNEESWEKELTARPRQNVTFEAGMAMGAFPKQTILIKFGKLRLFSDIVGRHVIQMTNSEKSRNTLASRLESAGCNVDKKGNRWLEIGDFSLESVVNSSQQKNRESQTVSIDENPEGISGGINLLIKKDFFSKPKNPKSVKDELESREYYHTIQEVSNVLYRVSTAKKPLKKLMIKGKKYYVLKK